MSGRLLAAGLVVIAGVALAQDKPKFGPEWTKDDKASVYRKEMPIRVTHSVGGNAQSYEIPLRHGKDRVTATDADEGHATSVTLHTASSNITIEERNDPNRRPRVVTVTNGNCLYFDLDCDGAWDAWYDRRAGANKLHIQLEGRWQHVQDTHGSFRGGSYNRVSSAEQKTEYAWDGKAWKDVGPRR